MTRTDQKPPLPAKWLLKRMSRYDELYSFTYEMEEAFSSKYVENGYLSASLWYWYQAIISYINFCWMNLFWSSAMFKNYIKIAFRNIKRNKTYSFINISGLTMGMTCCILIFLWIKDEWSYDRFHKNSDRIFHVMVNVEPVWWQSSPLALAPRLEQDFPEIKKAVRYAPRQRTFKFENKLFNETGAYVSIEFLDLFSFPLLHGDPNTAFGNRNSILVTEDFADRFFPGEEPIGKVVSMNNRYDLVITGILENVPLNSTLQFDFLVPIELYTNIKRLNTSWSSELFTYIYVEENADIPDLRTKLKDILQVYDTRGKHNKVLGLQSIQRLHLYNMTGDGPIFNVYIFGTIALLILCIACINFINLVTAKSGKRAKEIGLRKVAGAHRKDIINQFYSESMLTTLTAFFLSLIMVYLLLPSFNDLSAKQLSLESILLPGTIFGLFGIALFTGVISGSYPSLMLSSFMPATVLKGDKNPGTKGLTIRRALIVFQFIATIMLIICTGINYQQMNFIRNKDLGLNEDLIVAFPNNRQLRRNFDAFKESLKSNPAVINVTAASNYPTQISLVNPVYWEGKTKADYIRINHVVQEYDFFKTFEMEMVQGRPFSREYSTDIQKYVINEAALKLTGLDDPLGKMFSIWEDEGEIIGVVKNFHNKSLHSEITPTVFTLNPRHSVPYIVFIKISSENIAETVNSIVENAKSFSPDFPIDHSFADEFSEQQYRSDNRLGTIFKLFTLLAIFISCLGLIGISLYMAEQRTKEIGVRRVLGSSVNSIVQLLSKDFIRLVLAANLAAWPAAYFFMDRWLENFAYRTGLSPWIFILSGTAALIITIITVGYQSIKAATADPVRSIRHE